MFKAVLITLYIAMNGDVTEGPRKELSSMEECRAMKRQKEFTDFPPSGFVMVAHLCELS